MADLWTTISGLTKEELEGPAKPAPSAAETPDLSVAQIKSVVTRLARIESEGGYHGIAATEEIPKSLVIEIDKLRKKAIAELSAVELPAEIGEK